MHSTDGTREIVQRYGARLTDHERLTYVEPARNFALAQATGDWIIMLDPDERVPKDLAHELRHIATWDFDVALIPRRQVLFGKVVQSPGASDGAHPRFFRRGAVSWPAEVHGSPDLTGLRCYTIPARGGEFSLLHDTWRSVAVVLDKIVRYAPQDVERRRVQGEQFSVGILLKATFGGLLNQLMDGRAYEDGMAGLLTALYWSVYHMTIYAALWEAEGKPEQFDAQIQRWGRRLAPIGRCGRTIYRAARWCRSATNQLRR
jgi:glycosyltransferase involved in cell wall biosynthesis